MNYLNIITLNEARDYLRVDEDTTEVNSEIKSMLRAAFRHVERKTNIISYKRNISYTVVNGCVRVYDFPINEVVTPASSSGYSVSNYRNYKVYTLKNINDDTLTLSVGYDCSDDYPDDLKEVVLCLVKIMYYEQETNKSFNEMIPDWAHETLHNNKRFLI